MNYFQLSFISLVSVNLFMGCSRMTRVEVENAQWKYGTGFRIGDILILNRNNLRGDTILVDGKNKAIIEEYKEYVFFWQTPNLVIKDLNSRETGRYYLLCGKF